MIDPSAVPKGVDRSGSSRREGEILARGPNVFSGYRNRPEETDKVFHDGWFRTGDLGFFDDEGYLYVTSRVSTLIVTPGGKNVQPEAVENAYLEHPSIRKIGVLQKDGRLVAVVVPETDGTPQVEGMKSVVRGAIEQGSKRLPSYQRISDYAISRERLEYTRLDKLRRHVLEERYDRAKGGVEDHDDSSAGPIAPGERSDEDRALLGNPAAMGVWELLADRYPDRRLTPETSPQLDLDIDSLGWINLTLEIGEKTGVELGEEAIGRIGTVRDLLREVASGTGRRAHRASPLERPEEVLDDSQKRWLEPLRPAASVVARGMFALNRAIMRGLFRLRVDGLANLPDEGQFIIAPNHVSYLDAFVVAAALRQDVLQRTYWAGWTGAAFGNPLTRLVSRLAQVIPVDPDRAGLSSLAFGAAVLGRGQNLVWFAEGERSRTGSLQPYKPGVGMLLDHYPVPVVPVFIRGTYEAMPRGRFLRRLENVTVTFGEPFDPRSLEGNAGTREHVVEALRGRVLELGLGAGTTPMNGDGDNRDQRSRRREQRGWYFYDWANSAFFTTVVTVFLGPYLTAVAKSAADADGLVHPFGIPVLAGSYFPYVLSLSVALQVFLLPLTGAIADRTGRKKRLLMLFAYVGAVSTMGLYLVQGSAYLLGGLLFVIANLSAGASIVVYNAFLPEISGPDERDRVSSRAWALGYLGGGLLLAANLALFSAHESLGLSKGHAVRISLLSAGAWWALFTVIPLAALRDRRPVHSSEQGAAVALAGFRQLLGTLRASLAYPQTLLFLAAYLIYNDGIQTVITLTAVYDGEELELGTGTVISAVLMVQFLAFIGALLLGALARFFGAKRVVLASLVLWTGAVVSAFFLEAGAVWQFYLLAAFIGIVLGGSQALSCSLFSHMIPEGQEAEYFSLYEISERGTSWLGPLLFGLTLQLTTSYRSALVSLVIFFAVGFVLLVIVDVRRAIVEAGNQPPERI